MNLLAWLAFTLLLAAACINILRQDWRWNIASLAVQYLGVFWLVHASWSISLASVKLVTGWVVCTLLAIAHINTRMNAEKEGSHWSQGWFFRLVVICLLITVSYVGSTGLGSWLGMSLPTAWGGVLLISIGLVITGLSTHPFRLVMGLLTALAGFEILYAAVESSALVAGLLSIINLGLALAGAYFLLHPTDKVPA